jgi:hypothetical protein
MQKERRDFLKITAVGVTGLALARSRTASAAWPATGTLEINPDISNMRVVACVDKAMLKSTPTTMSFATQNAVVDTARVHADMDAMAMQLAEKTTADEAWKTIFRSSKPWASTLVAIKVNVTEPKNMPRVAVVEKFCRVLAGLGVPASNIIVYDGGPSSFAKYASNYESYFSTTDTSKIPGVISNVNDALGGTTNAPVPDATAAACTADIAKGKVDILVNVAVNKGHPNFGGATLCMKNHYGTFLANHTDLDKYILKINKSDAIIGGTPPRQQLCFIDSLIANKASNTGTPEVMPYYLVMGTFGPAVDYLTVKKIREEVMSAKHDAAVIETYMTGFGYTAKDPQWILVPPATATGDGGVGGSGGTGSGGKSGAGSGGAKGSGGAGPGGNNGSGGVSNGGAEGSGGVKTGGTKGSRDAGPDGNTGSGGVGSGGAHTSGGTGSGGAIGTGGKSSNNGGAGSGATSSASATGGSGSSGGTTGGAVSNDASGCSCRVGKAGHGATGLGITLTVGAILAGQLHRLFLRRESLAHPAQDQASQGNSNNEDKNDKPSTP